MLQSFDWIIKGNLHSGIQNNKRLKNKLQKFKRI